MHWAPRLLWHSPSLETLSQTNSIPPNDTGQSLLSDLKLLKNSVRRTTKSHRHLSRSWCNWASTQLKESTMCDLRFKRDWRLPGVQVQRGSWKQIWGQKEGLTLLGRCLYCCGRRVWIKVCVGRTGHVWVEPLLSSNSIGRSTFEENKSQR